MVAEAVKQAEAGAVDLRPRLAPGEVDGGAVAERRRVSRRTRRSSRVSPNNPVLLTHASGHASFANGKAMELSDVTPATPNPAGGEFLQGRDRQPDRPASRDARRA